MTDFPSFLELVDTAMKGRVKSFQDFNYPSLDMSSKVGQEFINGDFRMSPEMKSAMIEFGGGLINIAKSLGIDLSKTKEFQGADFNKDGKIDPQEAGAIMLAASMNTEAMSSAAGMGYAKAIFDNHVSREDVEKLLDPKKKDAVMLIAKHLLGDNGVAVGENTSTHQADEKARQIIGNNSDKLLRR
jgi:hypothetical protein